MIASVSPFLIDVLKKIKKSPHELYFVFSTQEEVGLRGATTAAYGIDPDLGIAVDVTGTGDTPRGALMDVKLGAGPAIKVKDGGMLSDPRLVECYGPMCAAAKYSIPIGDFVGWNHRCKSDANFQGRYAGWLFVNPDALYS